jgi:hypothetical protein
MGRPTLLAGEIQAQIIHSYGLTNSTTLVASYDFVRTLAESTIWHMEHAWQRDKFERLIRAGP